MEFGYNAGTEKFEDLIAAGVIDPVKVVRTALQNAASIAGLLLTTEAMVCDIPEEKKAEPMPQGAAAGCTKAGGAALERPPPGTGNRGPGTDTRRARWSNPAGPSCFVQDLRLKASGLEGPESMPGRTCGLTFSAQR